MLPQTNDFMNHLWDFPIKWKKLEKYIPREKEITVVDLGCGNGAIISEMIKINEDAEYIGLDASQKAIKEAEKNVPSEKFEVIWDGGCFPLLSESVDFIFCSEVIEHMNDIGNAFREMSRVLKKGGKVLITTPYHGTVKDVIIALFHFEEHYDVKGPHIRFFTEKALFGCMNEVGIEPTDYGYYGRFFPVPFSIYVLGVKQ